MSNPEQDKKMIVVNPDLLIKDIDKDIDFEKRYGFDKVLKKESTIKLVNFLKDIQKNSFYSDMPEFNLTQISTESFVYIQCKGEDFISRIFSKSDNHEYGLVKIINELKKESQKDIF